MTPPNPALPNARWLIFIRYELVKFHPFGKLAGFASAYEVLDIVAGEFVSRAFEQPPPAQ